MSQSVIDIDVLRLAVGFHDLLKGSVVVNGAYYGDVKVEIKYAGTSDTIGVLEYDEDLDNYGFRLVDVESI